MKFPYKPLDDVEVAVETESPPHSPRVHHESIQVPKYRINSKNKYTLTS